MSKKMVVITKQRECGEVCPFEYGEDLCVECCETWAKIQKKNKKKDNK